MKPPPTSGSPPDSPLPTGPRRYGPRDHGITPELISHDALQVVRTLRNAGFDVEPSIGDDFGAELRADIDRWVRVIRDAKIPRE